jgi:uncharacterized protein (DUF2252 family)
MNHTVDGPEASASVTTSPSAPNLRPSRKKSEGPDASTFGDGPHGISPDKRAEIGKALRARVPRAQPMGWKKPEHRPDPIDILQASDAGRLPELVPIRYGRMLQSPFAFYRGSAGVMAADLSGTPNTGIYVQACGDCHLMNFGGFATPERNIIFDINDFDETLPAPWEWDLRRLAASFMLAARTNGLSDAKGRDAAVICTRSYRRHLAEYSRMHPLDVWYARVTADDVIGLLPVAEQQRVRARLGKIAKQDGSEADFPKLAGMVSGRLGIHDSPPLIFHPEISRAPEFQTVLDQVLRDYRETLTEDRRVLLDRYQLVDAAIKVVGVGSVGRRCWIALMMSESNDPLFLQFKEAVASVMEPYAGKSAYAHHGQRVVMGQRLMQPASDLFLGWLTVEAAGAQFYVRQLRDAKIKPLVETFDSALLDVYAKACGWVLARAHAKAGDAATISGYLGTSAQFDETMGDFAATYADQAERDHAALKAAVRKGRVTAFHEAGA